MRSGPEPATLRALVAVSLLVGALVIATPAPAVTVTMGRPVLGSTSNFFVCSEALACARLMPAQTVPSTFGARASAPADGTITEWRMYGGNVGAAAIRLRVIRAVGGGQFIGAGTSAGVVDVIGGPNATSLPIRIGDHIAVDLEATTGEARIYWVQPPPAGGTIAFWPGLDDGQTAPPNATTSGELMLNATVELAAPHVTQVAPASGPPAGGQVVTIKGDHLANPSEVKFGDTPAASFTPGSNTQLSAVAPPGGAGTVDVTVATMAGPSSPSTGSRYTYVTPGEPGGPTAPANASFAGSNSSITVNRKRRFRFSFRATPGLAGTALFKSMKRVRVSRRERVSLARKSFNVPTTGRVMLKIRLSKKKFRILRLNRAIRTRVTVTLENADGLTSKASKKITLKAPQRRSR